MTMKMKNVFQQAMKTLIDLLAVFKIISIKFLNKSQTLNLALCALCVC